MTYFEPYYADTIRAGRAYVRLTEAASVLIEWEENVRSRRLLDLVRCHSGPLFAGLHARTHNAANHCKAPFR